MSIDEFMSKANETERRRRAKLQLDQTVRNPRWYVVLVVWILLLPISIPMALLSKLGDLCESADTALHDAISPLLRWSDRGARK